MKGRGLVELFKDTSTREAPWTGKHKQSSNTKVKWLHHLKGTTLLTWLVLTSKKELMILWVDLTYHYH